MLLDMGRCSSVEATVDSYTVAETLSPLSSYDRDEECNDSVVLTKSNRSVCGGHTSGPDTAGIPGCPNQETFLGNGYS